MNSSVNEDSSKVSTSVEKEDLLRLLACLQSELEARELVINSLKVSKVNCRAKYGVAGFDEPKSGAFSDPFRALHRDSLVAPSSSSNSEAGLKPLYDTQLAQLENLIASQRHAQEKMRQQFAAMEKKYLKARGELEEERKKHERDAAQGDDVLVMLEKERERLRSEIEYEKSQSRRLEKELKRVIISWREQNILLRKHKHIAVSVIKERRRLLSELAREQKRVVDLEAILDKHAPNACSGSCPGQGNSELPDSRLKVPTTSGGDEPKHTECSTKESASCSELAKECAQLRVSLTEEILSKKYLQAKFEKLQRDYQKLVSEPKPSANTAGSLPPNDTSISVDSSAHGVTTDHRSDLICPHRLKPNPPMRRSSEVSNTGLNATVQTSTGQIFNGLANSGDTTLQAPLPVGPSDTTSPPSPTVSTVSVTSPLTVTLPSNTASSPTSSSSRSSTPSPPPPPPPVQLHYPYPGMQSHLLHAQARTVSGPPPFLPSTSGGRSISTCAGHTPALPSTKPRGLFSHVSHQSSPPYQPPYSPASQSVNRLPQSTPQAGRGIASRKPTTVNLQQQQSQPQQLGSSSPNFHHPYPVSSYGSGQTKASPTGTPHFVQYPNSNQHPHPSSTGAHHFPAYPSNRQHVSMPTNPVHPNVRPSRSSVPSSPAGLSSGNAALGTGHICINGK